MSANSKHMKFYGLIPARYASSRFPGKPLANINGKPMINRVYEQAKKSSILEDVFVATDSEKIETHLKQSGIKFIMTSSKHKSGTERCLEAALKEGLQNSKGPVIIVNIQGDEPFIDPEQIDKVCNIFITDKGAAIATLVKPIYDKDELFDHNTVKCIMNTKKKAIYFSRSPIPYSRNSDKNNWIKHHQYFKHIGIYAYRLDVLKEITSLGESLLEKAESLEQLRWIENGYSITVENTDIESFSVDTPKDIENLMKKIYR